MKRVNLDQAGPAWRKWRKGCLGGSDACAVMGDVGWTSPDELLETKLDLRTQPESAKMARGKGLEPEARRLYCERYGAEMEPACVEHDDHPWLRARPALTGSRPTASWSWRSSAPPTWATRRPSGASTRATTAPSSSTSCSGRGPSGCTTASYRPEPAELQEDEFLVALEVLPGPDYQAWLFEEEKALWERKKALEKQMKRAKPKKRPRR